MIRLRQILRGKTLMIEVFHVNELNTSYIKMLELLQLDLPKQSYGLMEHEQTTTKPIAWKLIYDTITTNFEGKKHL